MKVKRLIFIALLMFVVLTGLLIFKSSGLLYNVEEELISYLEENYQIKIEVKETTLWPVNQIVLKDAKITSTRDQFSITVPEISIYYDFFSLLTTARHPGKAIDFISLNKPLIKINDTLNSHSDLIQDTDFSKKNLEEKVFGILDRFYATAPIQVKIGDGKLLYNNTSEEFQLENLNLLFKIIDEDECRIQLDTDFYADKLTWGESEFDKLDLNKLKLVMLINKDNWQGSIETDYTDISELSDFLTEDLLKKESFPITYGNINGLIQPRIYFNGRGLSLEEYNGVLSIKNGRGEFNLQSSGDKAFAFLKSPSLSRFQKINLGDINGDINFDSSNNRITTNEMVFKLNQNPFKLNGRLEMVPDDIDVFGHLRSNQLDITKFGFLPEDLKINGLMVMDFTVGGLLSDLDMNLDLSLSEGEVNNVRLENMVSSLRYYQGNAYLDQLNFILNGTSQFNMNGVFNKKNEEYSFDIEGRDIDINLLNDFDYLAGLMGENYTNLSGAVNLTANVTGKKLGIDGLNASGKIEIIEPTVNLYKNKRQKQINENNNSQSIEQGIGFNRLSSGFYLSEKKVFFSRGIAQADWGEMAFSGELGLGDRDLNVKLDSNNINIRDLIAYLDGDGFSKIAEEDLTGEVKLDGYIEGKISSPIVKADITSEKGSLKGYRYNDFTAHLDYSNRRLTINDLMVNYNQSIIKGQALMDLTGEQIVFKGNFSTEDLNYELINGILLQGNITGRPLPVEGNIGVMLSFDGLLTNPTIVLKAHSADTSIVVNDNKLTVDAVDIIINKADEGFLIDNILITKGDSRIEADGVFSQESLNIGYRLENISLQDILGHINNKQVEGIVNLVGDIKGTLKQPVIYSQIDVKDAEYQARYLGTLNGNLVYSDDILKLNSIVWKNDRKEYIIDGEISNVLKRPDLDISLSTEEGHLTDIAFLNLDEKIKMFSLQDYYFVGEAKFKGNLDNIYTLLDFSMINSNNSSDVIQLTGSIGNEIDLSIHGSGVTINKFLTKYTDADIRGKLELDGELRGSVNSLNILLDTRISDAALGEVSIKNIQGKVEIKDGAVLSLNQKVLFAEGSTLSLVGSFPFKESLNGLDFNLQLKRFPLQLLSIYSTSWPETSGFLSGDLDFSGGLSDPNLNGELNIDNASLDLGLPEKFTRLIGDVMLEGRQIKLPGFTGRYGDGKVLIQGLVEPFNDTENWDLVLRGKDLPFDYGSFEGRFDPDMTITGSFQEPYVKADLLTHDFEVGMPFRWPRSSLGRDLKFDFTLYPGKEVYLISKNINVLIQEGSLNINNLGDRVVFSGELFSRQGTFDFYNNKFIMDEGQASFERRFDNGNRFIPEVDVSAWTNVGGTRIEVQLTGKANNMVTTFKSSPPLSQDEILTLLTSRGGLGEFTSGDLDNVVQSELYRFLYSELQLDVVKNIQDEIKRMFELDRLEVDTYNLGWNNQLFIYVGKYLNKRLYLEYTDTVINESEDFLADKEGELSLQYLLDDNIILETSWQGEEDYSLSIETNLEF